MILLMVTQFFYGQLFDPLDRMPATLKTAVDLKNGMLYSLWLFGELIPMWQLSF